MDTITINDVRELAQDHDGFCVSLYMPTHTAGQQKRQDPIRFKNLLDEAHERLRGADVGASDVVEMLKPARALLDDTGFWRAQSQTLAVFLARGFFRAYQLPITVNELLVVNERFHLKPLFSLLMGNGVFYVLAISQNELRLLRCTRDAFEEVQSPQLPSGEDEILQYIEEQRQLQWHTQMPPNPARGGMRQAMFHGHGASDTHYKDRIFEYFRLVVNGLQNIIASPRTPLVFAGVEYLFPIFQRANQGLNLLDEHIGGNPDEVRISSEKLHKTAWMIVEPYFHSELRASTELYKAAAGAEPNRASSDLDEIVRAAADGRVASLFVQTGAHRWGYYDRRTGGVEVHEQPETGDEDLLDLATVETFMKDGRVYVVDPDDMPERAPIAAIYRY